ncbi:LOW QUALITY PROTEIN: IQ domain-containing protein M [Theristicus caerulescens]
MGYTRLGQEAMLQECPSTGLRLGAKEIIKNYHHLNNIYSLYQQKCNGSVSSQELSVPYCSWGSARTPMKRISITELLSGIDFVSRALENEKKENFLSLSTSLDLPCASPRPYGIPGFPITHKVQAFVHQTEKQTFCTLISSEKRLDLQSQKKVKENVTHLEVFEASCDSRKHPSSREELKAVICIQRYIRGWLEHRAFKRVKIKSTSHGPSLPAVLRYYHKMIARIKCQAGVLDLSTPLRYFELEEWMDKKKCKSSHFLIVFSFIFILVFDGSLYSQAGVIEKIDVVVQLFSSSIYETMFSKREFDKKMDRSDLPEFLRDCGYSIPASGTQHVFQLFCLPSTAAVRSIKKHQAIQMAFTLFPPLGAKVKNLITVPLPVHPLMDGKDGSKKSAFSHKSKKADFQVSAALATSSMSEGKENHLSDQDFWYHCMKSSW